MINITDNQIKILKQYLDNVDQLIKNDDINELLMKIDTAMLSTLDDDGEGTEDTTPLIKVYDQIFENN